MNRDWGGAQPRMRSSKIECAEGNLGLNDPTLDVGDTQDMNWMPDPPTGDDIGPFQLSPQEKIRRRHDIELEGSSTKNKTKAELKNELAQHGVHFVENENYTLKRLQEMAGENSIEIKKTERKILGGWVGKPKGLLQVCRERGLIDVANHAAYKKNSKKNQDGTVDESLALIPILSKCDDFKNEKTHLQVLAEAYGYSVALTPKFHAELAGEGIEYTWACSKGIYRRKPHERKKLRASFLALVDDCTSTNELTKRRVRRFSARARAYICTYHHFHLLQKEKDESEQEVAQQQQEVTTASGNYFSAVKFQDIERMSKRFRTHRCAFDFERGFVDAALLEEDS